ncbi:phage tail sheath C-terminal domain-containing protein [Sorangium sp. So ce385]|uniref:phage tail sheath C-terminal domain-containing protein n=1 Tax=Sorangium sp. So ce385 TaxID=3133308 RepID=UPI003F5BA278
MRGLVIELQAPLSPPAPNRADVACFVGFVARRAGASGPLPSIVPPAGAQAADYPLYRWFHEQGWVRSNERIYDRASSSAGLASPDLAPPPPPAWALSDADLDLLLDVPVPIDSWEAFERLFAWERRPFTVSGGEPLVGPSYLGAAVRSFFAQGGRRCYVVRVGDPWRYDAEPAARRAGLDKLLGLSAAGGVKLPPDRRDRATWKGVGHLYGLPEVSFVCLPDLADAVAAGRPWPTEAPSAPPGEEVFTACAERPPIPADRFVRGFAPPRADEEGYAAWAGAIRRIGTMLQRDLREIQLVASIPLPHPSAPAARADLLRFLASRGWLGAQLNGEEGATPEGLSSAFVQLAWPWVKTLGSRGLPAELESPDAVLTGVLSRNALTRGAYRSAARLPAAEVFDVEPGLRNEDLALPEVGAALAQRVSLIGPTPRGIEVLSDVTTSLDEAYRQANVSRLVTAIVRAVRALGEDVLFEAQDPRLWASIRASIESLLLALWQEGALAGATPAKAFQVRCDRSTMSERDVDEGRLVVEITLQATAVIERIRVVLAMSTGVTTAQVTAA